MNGNFIRRYLIIVCVVLATGCGSGSNSASDANGSIQWVTVSGRVVYQEKPIHALVLVNGQHTFTSQGSDGIFEVEAPLDQTGALTVNAFASGLAPLEQKASPPDTTDLTLSMSLPPPESPEMTLAAAIAATADGRMEITGRISSAGNPIGATVIANGRYAFSDPTDGRFDMAVVPAAESEIITIMVFAQGYLPYATTVPPLYATVEALATSYGSVQLAGTIETLVFRTVCDEWTGKGCISFWEREPAEATVDANGQQTTSNADDGHFELETTAGPAGTITVSYSTVNGIWFTSFLSAEDIVPWTYLAVNPTAVTLLTGTTAIAHVVGGKAPYTVQSTDASIASATSLGRLITIAGFSAGGASIIVTDSESYTATIEVSATSEGIETATWVPVRYEFDRSGDGYIDSRTYYTYGDTGLLTEATDYDHDGTMEHTVYYSCDADGRHCTVANEYSNSGKLVNHRFLTYDERGNLTRAEDGSSILSYTYNDNDQVVVFQIDHARDGVTDYAVYTAYDSHGYRTTEEVDEDHDGIVDFVSTYENTYDQDGKIIQVQYDNANDGSLDRAGYYVYNPDNTTLFSYGRDYQNDGVIDSTVYFGPDNRVDHVDQASPIESYAWELRVFTKALNIPDPLNRWVWDQF